jgi:hypothetical protein
VVWGSDAEDGHAELVRDAYRLVRHLNQQFGLDIPDDERPGQTYTLHDVEIILRRKQTELQAAITGQREPATTPVATEATIETEPTRPTVFRMGNWDLSEPGQAVYKGVAFACTGVYRKLLARLILAGGRAVHEDNLKLACEYSDMETGSLRGYISRLRKLLRSNLASLNVPADPIPHLDPDAYKLTLL